LKYDRSIESIIPSICIKNQEEEVEEEEEEEEEETKKSPKLFLSYLKL
jgi:hypothetical protein